MLNWYVVHRRNKRLSPMARPSRTFCSVTNRRRFRRSSRPIRSVSLTKLAKSAGSALALDQFASEDP
jgi:hypothetical protein